MNRQPRHRLPLILALVAASVAGVSAVAVGMGLAGDNSHGVRPQDVVDAEAGQAYLIQTIDLYYRQEQAETTGLFEFFRAPIEDVRALQHSLGVYDTAWEESAATLATVLAWSAPDASFAVPRPREGVEAPVTGDTFLILLEPGTGLEVRAVVASTTLDQLRRAGVDRVQATLALPATPPLEPDN